MKEEPEISDLIHIIQSLIEFIVIDGKAYVRDNEKREYVASYVLLLAKTINQMGKEEETKVVESIAEDIAKYIK